MVAGSVFAVTMARMPAVAGQSSRAGGPEGCAAGVMAARRGRVSGGL